MHKQPIEEFSRAQRPAFEQVEQPDPSTWDAIAARLPAEENPWTLRVGRHLRYSIAASLLLLVTAAAWWTLNQGGATTPPTLSTYYPELGTVEAAYQLQINLRKQAMDFDEIDPALYHDIFQELRELEQLHTTYLEDLPIHAQEEKLIHTLLRYYEQKMRILERLSKEIKNRYKHEKHHPTLTI